MSRLTRILLNVATVGSLVLLVATVGARAWFGMPTRGQLTGYINGPKDGSALGTYTALLLLFVPYWAFVAAAGFLPAFWLFSRFLNRVEDRRLFRYTDRCPTCGYDCRATPDRCPECGAVPTGPTPNAETQRRGDDPPRAD